MFLVEVAEVVKKLQMKFAWRCWRLWTLCCPPGWHASSMLYGDWGQCLWTGRLGWWFHFLKREPEGVLQLHGDHSAQTPKESLCQGAGTMCVLSWPWNSYPTLLPCRDLEGSWEIAHEVYKYFLDLENVYNFVPWGVWRLQWSLGYRGHCYQLSGLCIAKWVCVCKVTTVGVGLWQGDPLSPILLWYSWTGCRGTVNRRRVCSFGTSESLDCFLGKMCCFQSQGTDLQRSLLGPLYVSNCCIWVLQFSTNRYSGVLSCPV